MNFAGYILALLPSICAYVCQLESVEDEHSEYVRIASVRERIKNVVKCVKISRKRLARQL